MGGGGGGGGVGEERAGGRRPVVASEVSPLTEVAAAAGNEPFWTDKRAWERRTATTTARLQLVANGLASIDYSSLLGSVYCDFPQILKSFPFFGDL